MKHYFCASDIHSFYDEWIISLKTNGFELDNKNHIIIICGDLFDRGTQSVECYEFVKDLSQKGRLIYVKGNHEELLEQCVRDLKLGRIGRHHISNGTIKTLSDFMNCSEYDILCNCYEGTKFNRITKDVIDFIDNNSVDYYELGDKVFVHGWIPVGTVSDTDNTMEVKNNWREGNWSSARWENGIEMAHFKLTVPNKTVVCGHWHTSWGHSRYHKNGDEWDGATADFSPYRDNGIIAIDACTAYTRMVNVVVFDENGNEVN